jgi:hypothetical protein
MLYSSDFLIWESDGHKAQNSRTFTKEFYNMTFQSPSSRLDVAQPFIFK